MTMSNPPRGGPRLRFGNVFQNPQSVRGGTLRTMPMSEKRLAEIAAVLDTSDH